MEEIELKKLMASMTQEEKLAQLTQLYPLNGSAGQKANEAGPLGKLHIEQNWLHLVGSTLYVTRAEDAFSVQEKHLSQNQHQIPLLFMAGIIHGMETIFPVPLAMACSFDPALIEEACRIAALEASVCGLHVVFAPIADNACDPRWGRIVETMGEDPCLSSRMISASVHGYQGDRLGESDHVVACVKHFTAYGAPEGGRDYGSADLSEEMLNNRHLPSFQAAIDAGVGMVMASFNTVNGVPVTIHRKLLRETLREKMGFSGVVITDYGALKETLAHGVKLNREEAAAKALEAGVDIEMMSDLFLNDLPRALEAGIVSPKRLDEAVWRILTLKNQLGLFEKPLKDANPQRQAKLLLCAEHRTTSQKIAERSMVLLKNEGALPLHSEQKIGLCGPYAESTSVLGPWTFYARCKEGVRLSEGLRNILGESQVVVAADAPLPSLGDDPWADIPDQTEEALLAFAGIDTIVVAVGENMSDCGEAASRAYLRLSLNQEHLIRKLKEAGKKVIAIIFSGRPLELTPVLPYADAVLQAWFPGTESGHAIANILLGKKNPSGRLAVSFPWTVGQIPCNYQHLSTGRPFCPDYMIHSGEELVAPSPDWAELQAPKERMQRSTRVRRANPFVSTYLDCPTEALFPFGFGLSYSKFRYTTPRRGANNYVFFELENISNVEGIETPQLYRRQNKAAQASMVLELVDFQSVCLKPGEKKTICFSNVFDNDEFYVGPCSSHVLRIFNHRNSALENIEKKDGRK